MNKKKKILLITTDFAPSEGGGICTHSKFIVEGLSNLGWDFVIINENYIQTPESEIKEFARTYRFPIYIIYPAPSLIKLLKKGLYCLKIARKHKVDLILGTGKHPVWFAAFVSFFYRKPLVSIGHGTEFTEITSKHDIFLNKKLYGKSDLLLSISEYTKKVIHEVGIRPKKIEVVYNSADNNVIKSCDIESINSFKDNKNIKNRKIIVTVGSVSERKGQKVVIKALPKVITKIPNIIYVVAGIFKYKESYIKLIDETNTTNHVLFTGKVEKEELLLWLNAADCFIMTSLTDKGDYEGYGIAVVEAALCKKTSIVSDNAGLKEAVINNTTGIIVKENNIEETSDAIINLLSDDNLLKTLNDNAYNYALQNNTWTVKAKEYDKHISKLLKNK